MTSANASNNIHLSTMDLLVLATMKNAAKCENVVWIAEFNESSTLWTHIAPKKLSFFGMLGWVSVIYHNTQCCKKPWVDNGRCSFFEESIAWSIKGLVHCRWVSETGLCYDWCRKSSLFNFFRASLSGLEDEVIDEGEVETNTPAAFNKSSTLCKTTRRI